MERLDLTKYGYIKSQKVLEDGTPIYFPENCNSYLNSIYETFTSDLTGEKIKLSVGMKDTKYTFSDDDIEINNGGAHHKTIRLDAFRFSFNLYNYYCLIHCYSSAYNAVWNILNGLNGNAGKSLLNKRPQYNIRENACFNLREAFEYSGYYPFYECCFTSGNHHSIENYIPDKIFFNFEDRNKALNAIMSYDYFHNPTFDNVDYVNMTDIELIKFMNDRFIKRIKFENLIKN